MEPQKFRSVKLYRDYFETFFIKQRQKVKDKIIWTLRLVEEIRIVPETYLKHLAGTDGLYEVRADELARAAKLKSEYYEEKKSGKRP